MTRKAFDYRNLICACMFLLLLSPSLSHAASGIEMGIDEQLIEAVQENDFRKVRGLIAQGARINARTESGETPLHLAQSREMAELLLSNGADIHAKDDEFGMTPLFNAPKEIFEFLIANGADIGTRSKKGLTPLAWSAYGNDLDRIKLLISRGADVNSADGHLKTPLHIAANWNKIEFAGFLISKGANVNARDRSGWTPLHWASFEGGPEVMALLIANGAEKNAKTTRPWSLFPAGSTPLDIAEKAKRSDTATVLKNAGCKSGL
ncbi:MAG: ankyrin repeat domain-containing protein [Proteobacteria bacterium]|nr:ankyrin repeat domain-containing protein [Pseudomonadota bacterium]